MKSKYKLLTLLAMFEIGENCVGWWKVGKEGGWKEGWAGKKGYKLRNPQ